MLIKQSTHVFVYGAGDKHQFTGTPWVSKEGNIILSSITLKGTTSHCLQKSLFLAQKKHVQIFAQSLDIK